MGKKVANSIIGTKKSRSIPDIDLSSLSQPDILKLRIQKLEAANKALRKDFRKVTDLENALAESEEKYKTLLNTSVNTITIIRNGKIVFCNPACIKTFGYTAMEEVCGKDFSYFLDPLEYDELNKILKRMEAGRSTETAQLKLVKKNNSRIMMEFTSIPSRYESQPAILLIGQNITPWKESETALRESETRYISLFDNINSGVIIIQPDKDDNDFIVKDINKAALKIIKEKKSDIRSRPITGIFHDYINNGVIRELKLVNNNGEPKFIPAGLYHTDLFNGWLEHYLYKISGGEVIIVIEDVTEKYLALAELKKARREWQEIFEAIGQPALILDKDHNILAANKSVLRITGEDPSELSKFKCFEIFHSNQKLSPENCPLNSLIKSRGFEVQELEIEAFKGTYMVSCTPLFDEQGEINKIIHIATDITDIKNAKNALSASLVRYQKLVDTIPYGIVEIDLDGRIIYSNTAHSKMLGYEVGGLTGKTLYDLQLTDESQDIIKNYFELVKRDRPAPVPFISKNVASNGNIIDVQVDWNYLEDNEGHLQGFILVISDITERLKADKEIKAAKEKAEESDRLKTAFLANMSHEVRTPLNGIIGFSSLLNNEKITLEKRKEFTGFIQDAGNQLMNIINDLIDISKIESGQLSLVQKSINLDKIMNELFEFYQNEFRSQGKEHLELIMKTSHGDKDLQVISDEVRLRQVLINLLSNALKFTENGKIEFGYQVLNDTSLQFFVKDTGIGIAKENLDVIFERFRQEDDSFTREHGGAGLGLSISKGIIDIMGGKIWAESTKNKGSIFYFTIPYVSTLSEVATVIKQKTKYSWPGITIMVVEDDPINTALMKATFKNSDAQIMYAKDGKDALKVFSEHPGINLVLLDIRLPYLDGYSVARKLKTLNPGLTIIAHSAYAMEKNKLKASDEGFDGYITKPALPDEILELINGYIKQMRK